VPLPPQQITFGLVWDSARAPTVYIQYLTTRAMALPTNCSHSYNRSMTSLTKPGVSYLFLTLINKDIKYLTENSKVQTYNTVCLKSVLKLIRKKQKYVNFTYFKFPTFLSLLSSFVWWPGIRNTVLILPPICSKFRQFAKQLYARGCIKQSI